MPESKLNKELIRGAIRNLLVAIGAQEGVKECFEFLSEFALNEDIAEWITSLAQTRPELEELLELELFGEVRE